MNRHLRRHLEMEALFGADFLPLSRKPRAPGRAEPAPAAGDLPPEYRELQEIVRDCTKCGLHKTRTQTVFGTGPLGTPLLFVGEAPGADEDREGEPFVGRAGKLLTETLRKIGVERRRVYIANILKCRPPENRKPQFDEMSACMPYLFRQIRLIRPQILCALGGVAALALIPSKSGITQLRGRIFEAHGLKILPAFHPAYVLRDMRNLGLFETDLRKACCEAGLLP